MVTHRSHLVVEDVGTLWDVVLLPVAQTCWVKVFVLNSTFGRRWGTKRHGTWGRETWRHLHGVEAGSDERWRGDTWGE